MHNIVLAIRKTPLTEEEVVAFVEGKKDYSVTLLQQNDKFFQYNVTMMDRTNLIVICPATQRCNIYS